MIKRKRGRKPATSSKLVGAFFRQAREASGLSAREVAEELGVTRATISLYEHGHCGMPLEKAMKLSLILDASLDSLVDNLGMSIAKEKARKL